MDAGAILQTMLDAENEQNILGPVAQDFFERRLLRNKRWVRTGRLEDLLRRGEMSYYDNKSVDPRWGGVTKSGQKFDENKMTAAVAPQLWSLLGGKFIKVRNRLTGQEETVFVNDTGGFADQEHGFRVMDLSKEASRRLNRGRAGTMVDAEWKLN